MTKPAPKYIYILSDKRSGSTVLENLLAQMDGVFSAGELRLLQGHYLKKGAGNEWNWQCTCGEAIENCVRWSKSVGLLANKPTLIPHPAVKQLLKKAVKAGWMDTLAEIHPTRTEIAENCKQILQEIAPEAKYWIDSSKDPIQGYFMAKAFQNGRVLIIERNLRAIAYSKYKHKIRKGEAANILKLLFEVFRNAQLRKAVKKELEGLNVEVQLLRYEDFILEPSRYVAQILEKSLSLKEEERLQYFDASQQHSIAGTPSRFEKKELKLDDSWKSFYNSKPVVNALGAWLERRLK